MSGALRYGPFILVALVAGLVVHDAGTVLLIVAVLLVGVVLADGLER